MSCPNCPCAKCVTERATANQSWQPGVPYETPCAFDQIAKDYAARGEPMPSALLLYCPCKRCNPICL